MSRAEVARIRAAHVEELLEAERGELGELEHRVAQSLAASSTLAEDTDSDYDERRTEAKDRARAMNDYAANLKVELEVRYLHEKLVHILRRQWERLAEIQRLQLEIMQERRPRK